MEEEEKFKKNIREFFSTISGERKNIFQGLPFPFEYHVNHVIPFY
jgi:hypothetical protein